MSKFNVDEINRAADLIHLVEMAGGHLHKNGTVWSCPCPIHHGDNPTGFNIYPSKEGLRWKCFTRDCGGGDAIAFVMAWQNLDFIEACKYLTGETNLDGDRMRELAVQREAWLKQEMDERAARAEESTAKMLQEKHWELYEAALENCPEAIAFWTANGIPREWQAIWHLGYCPDFRAWERKTKTEFHTPTITIPLFKSGWQISNIRHRLLKPNDPEDKYRPEYYYIPSEPFIADPDIPKGAGKKVFILEGEKKAMVFYLTLDIPGVQVIGIPGKKWNNNGAILPFVENVDEVYICLDPDATHAADIMGGMMGDRTVGILDLPYKIDDMIIKLGMRSDHLSSLIKTARRPNAG